MHIPDGFLDAKTALATAAMAAAGLATALRQARVSLPPRRVPLLGLSAAFVFAAQMLNFPVAAGTSGHLIGAVLTGSLLGPSAAVIVLSAVLIVQCFLFADGGITALGANIFNMAVIGGVAGWVVYFAISRLAKGLFGRVLAATFAAWCSTVLAAIACAGELAVSHTVAWRAALPAMAGVHVLIGIGEGVITALVLAAIGKARPDLLGLAESRGGESVVPPAIPGAAWPAISARPVRGEGMVSLVAFGLLISLGLALFVAPFACSWPDGLDRLAKTIGFEQRATRPLLPGLAPEYQVPWIGSGRMATSVAGAGGTVIVFGLAWVLARVLVPARKQGASELRSEI